MTLIEQHLWRNVLWRAAEGISSGSWLDDLGEAKVCQLGITVLAQEDVLWFQVSVDNILAVAMCESSSSLRAIEFRLLVRKLTCSAKMCKELAAANTLHNDVNETVILCVARHVHHEWIVDLSHQSFLVVDVIHLLQLDNLMFFHELDRIELPVLLVLRKLHSTKRTDTKCPDHLKICQVHLLRHEQQLRQKLATSDISNSNALES
mmetsp:Transcript_21735/g.34968  ORF Transcript_21735/g.34968 Transcript_21735/m.34968 type:complete len:206 (+) Transcript_21735:422-1039(+)